MAKRPFKSGEWKVLCDVCGVVYRASEIKRRWDGAMCCPSDWELRQPLDFLRVKPENNQLPFRRPDPLDQFIPVHYTQTTADMQGVLERYSYVYVKYIPAIPNPDSGAINFDMINGMVLNGNVFSNGVAPTNEELMTLAETFEIIRSKTFNETISVSETTARQSTKAYSEGLATSETEGAGFSDSYSDSITISESVVKTPGLIKTESITSSETISDAESESVLDSLVISDTYTKVENKGISESITTTETTRFDITRVLSDTVTGSETITETIVLSRVLNANPINSTLLG